MPRYGFNFLWMFVKRDDRQPEPADEKALDLMADWGLDFVRVPTDYRFWTSDFDYLHPDEDAWGHLDGYLDACRRRGLHMSLNIHRGPGYCINRQDLEKHHLWSDAEAQDGFVRQWELLAQRYQGVPSEQLSFDLLNEPKGEPHQRPAHEAIIRRTVEAIRAIDPRREIVIDGWSAGGEALPELADLDVIHSTRGYRPGQLTHFGASWTDMADQTKTPTWPLTDDNGSVWDRAALRESYAPWRAVEARGTTVHVGEMGCYNKTPNDVALAWYADQFAVLSEFRWGYALWNFRGAFGIADHGRPGAVYENLGGFNVDRRLLELYLGGRVKKL